MSGLQGALIDTLLKGSLLLVLAAVATWLLRHRSAAARHAIWTTALLAQLALPLLSAGLPAWKVPLLPEVTPPTTLVEPIAAPVLAPPPVPVSGPTLVQTLSSVQFWIALLWIVGGIALLVRLMVGIATVARLARRAGEVGDGPWQSLTRYLAATLRIRRPIRLLRSDRIGVPVTWGVRRPTVLLPADADDWSAERRGLVLVHELAHVKRLDALTQLAAQGTLALFWINPLIWLALRQMAAERERACDDYVLRCGAVASTYAGELLEIVRSLRRSPGPALAALALGLARRSEFESRMLAILNPRLSRRALDRRAAWLLGVLAVLLVVPLAAFRPVPRQRPRAVAGVSSTSAAGQIRALAPAVDPNFDPQVDQDLAPLADEEVPTPLAVDEAPAPLSGEPAPEPRRTATRRSVTEAHRSVPVGRSSAGRSPKVAVLEPWPKGSARPVPDPMGDTWPWPSKKGATGDRTDPVICLSFSAPASMVIQQIPERTLDHGPQVLLGYPAPGAAGEPVPDQPPATHCSVNISFVRVSSQSSTPDAKSKSHVDFIFAWDGREGPMSADTLKVLQRMLETPEVIDLLLRLAPPRET